MILHLICFQSLEVVIILVSSVETNRLLVLKYMTPAMFRYEPQSSALPVQHVPITFSVKYLVS